MSAHTCRPGHAGILADGCERCREHSEAPMLLELDAEKTAALWRKMVYVEHGGGRGQPGDGPDHYDSATEAKAARTFYLMAVWLERYTSVDPWTLAPGPRRLVSVPMELL